MRNRIDDILFGKERDGFTADVVTLMKASREGLEFFRSSLSDVSAEDRPDYLKSRFLSSFSEKVGDWPWIVMQFIGRVVCEEVDWESVVNQIMCESFESN